MSADAGSFGLVTATFLASLVEFIEAFTIVLAMGMTRSWRSALTGVAAALFCLAATMVAAGYALINWVPESLLQFVIGALLLIFGLQWLRKAILRSSGLKAMHDEEQVFREEREAARRAGTGARVGLDWFSFVVSFKGVFLEGLEVAFIVITFGLTAGNVSLAAAGALTAGVVVLAVGSFLHAPLSRVPENTLKFAVGILLTTFGTFWCVEGLGIFSASQESLDWPGADWALPAVLLTWVLVSFVAVKWLGGTATSSITLNALEPAQEEKIR